MTAVIRNFYASGNTARGFVSLYDSSLRQLRRLFVLQGGPSAGKTGLIREIGDRMAKEGHEIWYIHSPFDNDALDGLIVPGLKAGIVDGTAPRVIRPEPKTDVQYVDLDAALGTNGERIRTSGGDRWNEQIRQTLERAYSGFAEALRIHDEWESFYIANIDVQAAEELTKEYISILYGDQRREKESRVDRRFLGAATPKGAVDFVPNLTEGLKRYLMKGRPGSGKSTMLKKIAAAGIERGFDVEIYHCGFDPNSLDMVIVRELGFAIFDSTAPHEYFPERPTDEIVDLYARCIKPGTDEAHADAIRDCQERYSAKMKQAIRCLAEAKALQDELEDMYARSVDLRPLDRIKQEMVQKMTGIAATG